MIRFLNILDEIVAERQRERNDRPRTSHWPSSASAWLPCEGCLGQGVLLKAGPDGGVVEAPCPACKDEPDAPKPGLVLKGECVRREVFAWLGVPQSDPMDTTGFLNTFVGDIIEEQMAGLFAKRVPLVRQIAMRKQVEGLEYPVSGKEDWHYWDIEERLWLPLDVKSVRNSWGLKDARDGHPRDTDWLQMCCYWWLLQDVFPGQSIPFAKFLYFARQNFDRQELSPAMTEESVMVVVNACIARWWEVEAWVRAYFEDNTILPPAEYRQRGTKGDWSHWKCRLGHIRRDGTVDPSTDGYCPYRHLCHDIEDRGAICLTGSALRA